MKRLRSIIKQLATIDHSEKQELNSLIWEFICYSPQWPLRPHQQELLDDAEKFSVKVNDPHFAKGKLNVNGFKWGNGELKILVTHGWGSKATDFYEVISALRQLDLTVIAFDAPGNGSSDGELSNLLLFAGAVKAVVTQCGIPDISIGHSLGAMANVIGLEQTPPRLMISLSPLIRLKENFISSMSSQSISQSDQEEFFQSFVDRFDMDPADFNMNKVYNFDNTVEHFLAFDNQDLVSPYPYLEDFLQQHPWLKSKKFEGVGHERIIKDEGVIGEIVSIVRNVE